MIAQPGASNPTIQTPVPTLDPIPPLRGATDDKSLDIGLVSAFFGFCISAYYSRSTGVDAGAGDRVRRPGVRGAVDRDQSSRERDDDVWSGGLLRLVAGLGIGVVGDRTERRFTTWAGGIAAALGALTVALDSADISHVVGSTNVKLAGPGLLVHLVRRSGWSRRRT